ncbi:hypothetical protein D9M68_757550 [compost metagenome]
MRGQRNVGRVGIRDKVRIVMLIQNLQVLFIAGIITNIIQDFNKEFIALTVNLFQFNVYRLCFLHDLGIEEKRRIIYFL